MPVVFRQCYETHRGDVITGRVRMEWFSCTRLRSFNTLRFQILQMWYIQCETVCPRSEISPVWWCLQPYLLPALVWPQDAEELFRQGGRLFAEANPDAAMAAFQRSVELRPEYAPVWKALGVVYASRGEFDRAEAPFRNACERQPALPDACLYYGRTLHLLNRFQPAINVLRRTIRKSGKTDAIAIAAPAHQFQSPPVIGARGAVAQEDRLLTDARNHRIHQATVIEIAEGRAAVAPGWPVCRRFEGPAGLLYQHRVGLSGLPAREGFRVIVQIAVGAE